MHNTIANNPKTCKNIQTWKHSNFLCIWINLNKKQILVNKIIQWFLWQPCYPLGETYPHSIKYSFFKSFNCCILLNVWFQFSSFLYLSYTLLFSFSLPSHLSNPLSVITIHVYSINIYMNFNYYVGLRICPLGFGLRLGQQ